MLTGLGVLALVWPSVSILVLAVLVGVFFIVFGIFSFVCGLHMLDLHHALRNVEADQDLEDEDVTTTRDSRRHAA